MTEEQKVVINEDIQKIKDACEEQNSLWLSRKLEFMARKYSDYMPGLEEEMKEMIPISPDFHEHVSFNAKKVIEKLSDLAKC